MSIAQKKEFVIKHVFPDIMSLNSKEFYRGKTEYHFNVPWDISIYKHDGGRFLIYLNCWKRWEGDDWSIETETEFSLISTNGENLCKNRKYRYGCNVNYFDFLLAEIKKYLVYGKLTVEMHVKITEINGIRTEKLRNFDESMKEFSDVTLIVKDEKFYVLKMYLASHSSYFKSLFYGNFEESKKKEIPLEDIDPYDFQYFLEVIYGEPAVDEDTVRGILRLASMYDSKTAIRQCEKFLLEKSKQTLNVKFELAIKYKMDILRKKCLSEMGTKEEVISWAPKNPFQMDSDAWAEMFNKLASFK